VALLQLEVLGMTENREAAQAAAEDLQAHLDAQRRRRRQSVMARGGGSRIRWDAPACSSGSPSSATASGLTLRFFTVASRPTKGPGGDVEISVLGATEDPDAAASAVEVLRGGPGCRSNGDVAVTAPRPSGRSSQQHSREVKQWPADTNCPGRCRLARRVEVPRVPGMGRRSQSATGTSWSTVSTSFRTWALPIPSLTS